MAGRPWVFGYGSLICPESISRTVERRVRESDYLPARIHGFRKAWGARHRSINCVTPSWKPVEAENLCALYLQRDADGLCHGGVLQVDERELDRLDLRERHYERIRLGRVEVRTEDGTWAPFDEPVFTYYPRHPAETPEAIARGEVRTTSRYFNMASQGLRRLGLEDDAPPIQTLECFDVDVEFGQHWTLREDDHLLGAHRRVQERHTGLLRYRDQLAERLVPPGNPPTERVARMLRPVILSHSLLERVAAIAEETLRARQSVDGHVDFAIWRPFVVVLGVNAGSPNGAHDLLADAQEWSEMLADDPLHPPFPFRPAREHLAEQPACVLPAEGRDRLVRADPGRAGDLPLLFAPIASNGTVERRSLHALVRVHVHAGRAFDLHAHAAESPEQCLDAGAFRAPIFTTPSQA